NDWSASDSPSDFDTDFGMEDTPLPEPAPSPPMPARPAAPIAPTSTPVARAMPAPPPEGIDKRTKLIATGASVIALLALVLFLSRGDDAPDVEPPAEPPAGEAATTKAAEKAPEPEKAP